MEIFKRVTHIDFIGRRRLWIGVSMFLNALTLVALFVYGPNFGLDFTGRPRREVEGGGGQAEKCLARESKPPAPCAAQVKRVEFVGPQVGRELAEKGGLALLFSAIGILIYAIFRFEGALP